jgi:hypothetical protein
MPNVAQVFTSGVGFLFFVWPMHHLWDYHRLRPCASCSVSMVQAFFSSWPMHHLDGIIIGYNPAHHAMSAWCGLSFSVGRCTI